MLQQIKKGNLTLNFYGERFMSAYSYQTCVMTRADTGTPIVNVTKYSRTTSKQLTMHVWTALQGEKAITVENLPREVTPQCLRKGAPK